MYIVISSNNGSKTMKDRENDWNDHGNTDDSTSAPGPKGSVVRCVSSDQAVHSTWRLWGFRPIGEIHQWLGFQFNSLWLLYNQLYPTITNYVWMFSNLGNRSLNGSGYLNRSLNGNLIWMGRISMEPYKFNVIDKYPLVWLWSLKCEWINSAWWKCCG